MTEKQSCETKARLERSRNLTPVREGTPNLKDYEVYGITTGSTFRREPNLKKENFDSIDYFPNGQIGDTINATAIIYHRDKNGMYVKNDAVLLVLKRIKQK